MITVEQALRLYQDNDAAHGFDHVLRVWRLAMRIAAAEGADLEIVGAAALLHDAGRAEQERTGECHAQLGAQIARQVLGGHPQERVEAVARAIEQHRFRAANPPTTLEARALYDADKLDAIGAIGVARAYAIAGARKQRLWAPVDLAYAKRTPQEGHGDLESDAHTPVHEYLYKLVKLKDGMLTDTGRDMAEERHRFMVSFFQRLEQEVAGEI
jgi:uncharacterized protein